LYGIESYIAVPLTRKDGSYFGTLCTLDPEPIDHGDEILAIFHLLSKLIAFQLEEDEDRRRRDRYIRTLEDVVGIAGHDIRQPLTAAYGGLQLLARRVRRGLDTDVAGEADHLAATVRRAVALSETLLDVAQSQVSGMALDRTMFDLVRLARRVLEETRAGAPAHTLMLEAPDALLINGDERRIERVLGNLLDNAVKYAPAESGPIVLALSSGGSDPGSTAVQVCVRDSGLGVPDNVLPQIFERHFRASDAVDRDIPGSGLGLYIVRQIVETHGGRVHAGTSPEGGLSVCLTVPSVQ
jgi:signal transduction histidine kinase